MKLYCYYFHRLSHTVRAFTHLTPQTPGEAMADRLMGIAPRSVLRAHLYCKKCKRAFKASRSAGGPENDVRTNRFVIASIQKFFKPSLFY